MSAQVSASVRRGLRPLAAVELSGVGGRRIRANRREERGIDDALQSGVWSLCSQEFVFGELGACMSRTDVDSAMSSLGTYSHVIGALRQALAKQALHGPRHQLR